MLFTCNIWLFLKVAYLSQDSHVLIARNDLRPTKMCSHKQWFSYAPSHITASMYFTIQVVYWNEVLGKIFIKQTQKYTKLVHTCSALSPPTMHMLSSSNSMQDLMSSCGIPQALVSIQCGSLGNGRPVGQQSIKTFIWESELLFSVFTNVFTICQQLPNMCKKKPTTCANMKHNRYVHLSPISSKSSQMLKCYMLDMENTAFSY